MKNFKTLVLAMTIASITLPSMANAGTNAATNQCLSIAKGFVNPAGSQVVVSYYFTLTDYYGRVTKNGGNATDVVHKYNDRSNLVGRIQYAQAYSTLFMKSSAGRKGLPICNNGTTVILYDARSVNKVIGSYTLR